MTNIYRINLCQNTENCSDPLETILQIISMDSSKDNGLWLVQLQFLYVHNTRIEMENQTLDIPWILTTIELFSDYITHDFNLDCTTF